MLLYSLHDVHLYEDDHELMESFIVGSLRDPGLYRDDMIVHLLLYVYLREDNTIVYSLWDPGLHRADTIEYSLWNQWLYRDNTIEYSLWNLYVDGTISGAGPIVCFLRNLLISRIGCIINENYWEQLIDLSTNSAKSSVNIIYIKMQNLLTLIYITGDHMNQVLKLLRIAKGFSTGEVAEKLGVSQSLISRIELGDRNPSDSLIQKYSELFRVKVSTLNFFAKKEHDDDLEYEELLLMILQKICDKRERKREPVQART